MDNNDRESMQERGDWNRGRRSRSSLVRSIKWRTVLSIVTGFGWLIFLVIWLFFYAGEYTFYQNLGVILASLIVLFFANGSAWKSIEEGQRWKSIFSVITGLILGIFLVYWLFYHASDYTLLENIGVFFLSVLIIGAVNSLVWIPTGSRAGWRSAVSAVSGIGWLIFLVYWLIVMSSEFNIYQNIAVFIVSVLVLALINIIVWLSYIFK